VIRHATPARDALKGSVRVPGDKSISHRAVLFSAISDGPCGLAGVLDSEDVRATITAVRSLGAKVDEHGSDARGLLLEVTGWGSAGPTRPLGPIDCGNSGTTARLLMGALAGWDVEATLTGDASLSARPMRRVTEPLAAMGARLRMSPAGTLPVTVRGGELRAMRYESPVASAQVKSAVLLAGVRAYGRTTVVEPAPSRDHTERMLPAFGVGVGRDCGEGCVWVDGPEVLHGTDVEVPGDPSSAAFLVAAACIVPGSAVELPDIALNPTRTGFLRVLARMGARVGAVPTRNAGAEPIGRITAEHEGALVATTVAATEVPSLVDEVPVLAVVATQAAGTTRFEGVGELRVKESDRLAAIAEGLTALGAVVRSGDDWLEIDGPARLKGCDLDSLGDHRLAMAWAVAALIAGGSVGIERWESVAVSYPRFEADLESLGA
jgi:3-phosphoshikimate 1-carboxyvinyltransferase